MAISNQSAERYDRLIDWDASLTPRDEFFDRVSDDRSQLRIKYGADITASTLHLGHAVNLRVMREMQDQGHRVVFLLGGFTTLVGDPTDRLQARTAPELEDMDANTEAFIDQVKKVLRFDDQNLLEIRNNTEWWGGVESDGTIRNIDFFRILGDVTLRKLLSRDMFRRRQEEGTPIQMSEFLYPVLQGYDSVMVESDITVVGTDQLFNESMGRDMQASAGQDKQMIVCTRMTPGLDGGQKQSKSVGNYVGLAHGPDEMYNRIMRLRDELTPEWLDVYSSFTIAEIEKILRDTEGDPLARKAHLAYNVTKMFHDEAAAESAQSSFDATLRREKPAMSHDINVSKGTTLRHLLQTLGYKTNNIKQMIESGSLTITGDRVNTWLPKTVQELDTVATSGMILRVGKKRQIVVSSTDG